MHTFPLSLEEEGFTTDTNPKDLPGWKTNEVKASLVLSTGPPVAWNSALLSPEIVLDPGQSYTLQWEQEIPTAAGTPGDEVEVRLSVNSGASWTVLYGHNPAGPGAQNRLSIDLSAITAGSESARLAFDWTAEASSGGAYWTVDNLVLGAGTPPIFTLEEDLPPTLSTTGVTKNRAHSGGRGPWSCRLLQPGGRSGLHHTPTQVLGCAILRSRVDRNAYSGQSGAYDLKIRIIDENGLSSVLTWVFQVQ